MVFTSASSDQTVRLWIASIEEMLALAEQKIAREPPLFTPEEKERCGIARTSRWPSD